MIWLIILLALLSFIAWLLITPLVFEVDTRIPCAGLKWRGIGSVGIWYENEWWLTIRVFFYRRTIRLSEIMTNSGKIKEDAEKKTEKRRIKTRRLLMKLLRAIRTFRVTKWELTIDTGDNVLNAQLYPLNYLPCTFKHLEINFRNENYLFAKISNRPWRILRVLIW